MIELTKDTGQLCQNNNTIMCLDHETAANENKEKQLTNRLNDSVINSINVIDCEDHIPMIYIDRIKNIQEQVLTSGETMDEDLNQASNQPQVELPLR